MVYTKPQVALLGNAARLIQGSKNDAGDAGSLQVPITQDCELND